MNTTFLIELVNNAALLICLGLAYDIFYRQKEGRSIFITQVFFGLSIGIVSIALMSTPAKFTPGIIFDTRTILLCVTGLYFGPITTGIAILIAAGYRYNLGGIGAIAGIATILTSGAIGVLWSRNREQEEKVYSLKELYAFGLTVHIVMLMCMFLLPTEVIQKTIRSLILPATVIYPLGTALLGYLLCSQKKRIQSDKKFKIVAESERELADIVRTAPIAIAYGYPDGKLSNCNSSFAELTGYSIEELQAINWNEVLTPKKWRSLEKEKLDQLNQHNKTVQYEKEYIHKGGRVVPIELTVTARFDSSGALINYIGFVLDITKRKNAEKALLLNQYYLTKSQKLGQIGTWELDIVHGILIWTDQTCRIFGVQPASVVNYHVFINKVHPEDRDYVNQEWQAATGGKPYDIEHRLLIDGEVKWVREKGDVTFDDDGTAISAIGFTQDITARKNAETSLRESEERYKTFVETSPIAIYASSGVEQKAEYVNPAFIKLFGYTLEEVPTVNEWWPLAYPEEKYRTAIKDEWQKRVEHAIATKSEIEPIETVVTCKDGSEKIISWGFSAVGKQNWALGLDITTRKQAEEQRLELETQLHKKHKMEAVGYMAGGMAHNFNNNLSIILGNVELSQMKQAPGSEVIPLLENAKIAVRRSRDLVQKIITYSRRGIQHTAPMLLTTIIDETIDLLSLTLPTTVTLQKNFGPDCDKKQINADASQIQEVLINLCNNAIHAMDEKGLLKISLHTAELEEKNILAQYDCLPGHYVKLSVQDSGCGIPAEILDKIFDPFYSTKDEHEGAGMGLSTVQGIVAQHGGIINVNSSIDQGTTFDLYFPTIEQTSLKQPEPENTTLPKGSERILFVDDDVMLATLGEKLLSEMGYQVNMMTDSTEALKMFTANADGFDLVITDQTMPNLTGNELIDEIKKVRADILTILCTGHSSKIDEEKATERGISAFLMKPLDLSTLSQTIRWVLDGKKDE